MCLHDVIDQINTNNCIATFQMLYGTDECTIDKQKKRYVQAIEAFRVYFPSRLDISIFSAPGRTEIGGNHTDHQRGAVLAGAVDLDAIAVVAFHGEKVVRVKSEGYMISEIKLDHLQPDKKMRERLLLPKVFSQNLLKKGS